MRVNLATSVFWFGVFGVLTTAIHVAVFTALVEILRVPPVLAAAPSFAVAVLVSYFCNRRWTFRSQGGHDTCLPRFMLVALGGLLANVAITYLVVNLLGLRYGVALGIVITVIPVFTYVVNRRWTFAPSKDTAR